ncbi:hypothetical protein [Aliiruegeria sabulilitoris]|uniref:hypothetical protein n=1 Tax=Aliiruegeria sabulilitoris TaxID=1510458 RepID=UPI000832D0E3|nr:hypothetical protein [Aliiruegeria sabulilitoris]NDR58635.1 hypothetical protein [Pseudoruegeria sp. M32A2M]
MFDDRFQAILEDHDAHGGDNGCDVTVIWADGLPRPDVEKRIDAELRSLPGLGDASHIGFHFLELEDGTGVLVTGSDMPGFVTAECNAEVPQFDLDALLSDADAEL